MKRTLLSVSICLMCTPVFSQWTSNGNIISTTQNVGIGTTAPAFKLDVNGDIRSKNIILPSNLQMSRDLNDNFTYQGKSMGHYALGWMSDPWNTTGATLWQSGYAGIKFFTEGKPRLSINISGNIGIGMESPQYKLDVNGDIRSKNMILPSGFQLSRDLTDNFTYQGKSMGQYAFAWMSDSWYAGGGTLWQSGYAGIKFFTGGSNRMGIDVKGNVGIGVDNPQNKLEVAGTIRATEVKIEALPWADFVFAKDYKLRSLEEVKAHIDDHKHLPDIPSEAEVKENGVSLGEMQAKLLQKIEELTLYVIQQDAKNKALEQEMKELKASLSKE